MMRTTSAKGKNERGMALLLTLFALLLLSALGLFMVLSSNTETRIDTNYGTSLRAYYSARSGLEEIRDRIKYTKAASPGGLADQLPQDVAGNAGGVLYVLNPANGEVVDPTDPTSPYFDDELCRAYASNTPKGVKCTVVPTSANWQMLPAQVSMAPASGPLGYKWIRINMKTNRIADPYFVDQGASGAPLDTRICWDGQVEQLSPGTDDPSCEVNGMQTVYMLTALAATPQANRLNGARKLVSLEVVAPSIRPAGVLTASVMNLPSTGNNLGISQVAIDGRAHDITGVLSNSNSCSSIASLATDSGSSQIEQALNQLRKNIVDTANNSCNPDGTSVGSNKCTSGLWWVRGTDPTSRFVTSNTSGSSGESDDDEEEHDDDHRGRHHDPTGIGAGAACDPTNPSCYTHLDLASPQLFAISATSAPHVPAVTLPDNFSAPFIGGIGNQADATVYQPAFALTVQDQINAVNKLVNASVGRSNYFTPSSATLAGSYGTQKDPAVVVFGGPGDSTLSLNLTTLTGFGILVVPSALEITNSTLNWNGIVLIKSPTGHVTINSGAQGSINGTLLLAPGATMNLQSFAPSSVPFRLTYSCDAVDLPFHNQPFKIISTAESSF